MRLRNIFFAMVMATVMLSGCATRHPNMYTWGNYEAQVYAHFKSNDNPEQQIAALEKSLSGSSRIISFPPGYHAHLGLLYGEAGRIDEMKKEFESEKLLFPESAPFMDFMLQKLNKNTQGAL